MKLLPTERAHRLATRPPDQQWLVEGLWGEGAVGIVGGEPKSCKSLLALDLVISVASGRPCLGRFAVTRPGRVLLFAAEDALSVVRMRLESIAASREVQLEELDVEVITAPIVRLDDRTDRERLRNTVATLQPRLLVLDPFVRLHCVDENAAGEVAPLLAFLRELNRDHGVAVVVVHHARKGGGARAGQALRGSSEFHAWGDSNLYLRRRGEQLELSAEHRAARSEGPFSLELESTPEGPALCIVDAPSPEAKPVARSRRERVIDALSAADGPAPVAQLRRHARMQTQAFLDELHALVESGEALRTEAGYCLPTPSGFLSPDP